MKNLVTLFALLVAACALVEATVTNVTIHLAVQTNSVSWGRSHNSLTFMCKATIENQTRDSLTVSNAFQDPAGLSLKVTDKYGVELSRLSCMPFKNPKATIAAGGSQSFWPYYGIKERFSVPETNTTVNIQLEGRLLGSGYTGSVTSNVVELKVP